MDPVTDNSLDPVGPQSPDPLISANFLLEEAEKGASEVKLGKRGPSEEQDFAHEPLQKKAKPETVNEHNFGVEELPVPAIPRFDLEADKIRLELLYNKLEVVLARSKQYYHTANIYFEIPPAESVPSSILGATLTVFIFPKAPFPPKPIKYRLEELDEIDERLHQALREPTWRPQKMVYYILHEEYEIKCGPDEQGQPPKSVKNYTGGYWAEARRPLGGPQGFDYYGAFTRTHDSSTMVPSSWPSRGTRKKDWETRRSDWEKQKPDWGKIRIETDTKYILGDHTTKGKVAQYPPEPEKSSAPKRDAGRAASRKPKQDYLRKNVVTKQAQGL